MNKKPDYEDEVMDAAEMTWLPEEIQALRDADPTKKDFEITEGRDTITYTFDLAKVQVVSSLWVKKVEVSEENGRAIIKVTRPESRIGKVVLMVDGKQTILDVLPYYYAE
jgi:hypothetical protein